MSSTGTTHARQRDLKINSNSKTTTATTKVFIAVDQLGLDLRKRATFFSAPLIGGSTVEDGLHFRFGSCTTGNKDGRGCVFLCAQSGPSLWSFFFARASLHPFIGLLYFVSLGLIWNAAAEPVVLKLRVSSKGQQSSVLKNR